MGYHAAHLAGLIEYLATNYFYSKKYDGLVGSLAFIVPGTSHSPRPLVEEAIPGLTHSCHTVGPRPDFPFIGDDTRLCILLTRRQSDQTRRSRPNHFGCILVSPMMTSLGTPHPGVAR